MEERDKLISSKQIKQEQLDRIDLKLDKVQRVGNQSRAEYELF